MNRSRRFLPLAALLLLGATACGGSRATENDDVPPQFQLGEDNSKFRIVPKATSFAKGGSASLEVVNDSTLTASGGVCAHALEVLVGGDAWGRVNNYDTVCVAMLMIVQPGQKGNVSAGLPANLQAGTYRSVHRFSFGDPNSGRDLPAKDFYSAPFQVR